MTRKIGAFTIHKRLGDGQFGTVYLGEGPVDSQLTGSPVIRTVAIKILNDPGDPTAQASLVREFRLMDQVRHRSLCS